MSPDTRRGLGCRRVDQPAGATQRLHAALLRWVRGYGDARRRILGGGLPLLNTALEDTTCAEIWVKADVYKPGISDASTFWIAEGKQVYGGFVGTETTRAQRNPVAHLTILSGDIDGNDINTDGNNIDETTADIVGRNSYHVVFIDGSTPVTAATVLDGFVITGGDSGPTIGSGGGLYCNGSAPGHACNPTLNLLVFSGNRAAERGGGLFNSGINDGVASPVLSIVVFTGNRAGNGGAVYNDADQGTSSPVFVAAAFRNNSADSLGGAMYNNAHDGVSNPVIEESTFLDNSASFAGAIYSTSGTSVDASGQSIAYLTNVTFRGNQATSGSGGALLNIAGPGGTTSPQLLNVTITENTSTMGAAAIVNSSSGGTIQPVLTNVIVWWNNAGFGWPISNNSSTPTIYNSIVQGSGGSGAGWQTDFGVDGGGNLDVNPMLGALMDDWGMPLLWGSPAIDAGSAYVCPPFDQRYVTRPQGSGCDIGAYERIPPRPVADFDANLTTDLTVFRPSTGVWYIKNQTNTTWGTTGDVPVPGDYDGNGHTDVAIWRPSTGIFYVKNQFNSAWGSAGDVPVPGDYDGDRMTEVAVWRPSDAKWYVKAHSTTAWGANGDVPIQADYNGDGRTELAVFRPSTGVWYIKGIGNFAWGNSTDIPVPADYNEDGNADIAVFRPSTGIWYIKGIASYTWGTSTDIPVPGDFNGDGKADIAIFRPSTGQWMVKNQFTATWGANGDFPVVAPDTNGNGTPYQ